MMELSRARRRACSTSPSSVADEQGLPLLDLKDLQALLVWLGDNADELARPTATSRPPRSARSSARCSCSRTRARRISSASRRSISTDLMRDRRDGPGPGQRAAADKLMQSPRLYAMFLLWLLSELFEQLPEVGDPDKPVLVFFFDEAHLLFNDAPEGAGRQGRAGRAADPLQGRRRLFRHPEPDDVPETCWPARQPRAARAARLHAARPEGAEGRPPRPSAPNPDFDTETAIREVGTGEAVVSLLEEKGVPAMVSRTLIRPPESRLGPITAAERAETMAASPVAGQYDTTRRPRIGAEILAGARREGGEAAAATLAEEMLKQAARGTGERSMRAATAAGAPRRARPRAALARRPRSPGRR